MNLTISGHHLEVTPSAWYVLTKLDRVTRHFDQVVDINVLLSVEKLRRRNEAEGRGHAAREGKGHLRRERHEDLYAAIDQLMDKLDRQVCRHKEMLQDHHHRAASAWTPTRPVIRRRPALRGPIQGGPRPGRLAWLLRCSRPRDKGFACSCVTFR